MADQPKRNKEGRGALYKNTDENPHPQAPGYRGRFTLLGTAWKISAWVETTRGGKNEGMQYLSLKIDADTGEHRRPPEETPRPADPPTDQQQKPIPF